MVKKKLSILLVLHPSGNAAVKNSITWIRNFYEPLVDLGHEVDLINLLDLEFSFGAKWSTEKFKYIFSEFLIKYVREQRDKKKYDLIFCYLRNFEIFSDAVAKIKSYSIPMLNYSCNNTHQFDLVSDISKHFDINLYSEKNSKIKFDLLNVNSYWFQMAANPNFYKKLNLDFKYDITFIGSIYANRSTYIGYLLHNDIDLRIYGPTWYNYNDGKMKSTKQRIRQLIDLLQFQKAENRVFKLRNIFEYEYKKYLYSKYKNHFFPPIKDEEIVIINNQSRISLGIMDVLIDNSPHLNIDKHLHLREFEVPMCGSLYITSNNKELEDFYIPDKEVLIYSDVIELKEKIQYYLKHEKEAENIRIMGHKRALNCHTYHNRFNKLFKELNFV